MSDKIEKSITPRRGYHHGHLKEALIEAARALVAERGPAGFTLAEAAKRVGVTGAAPYRHFTDRDALLDELARRGFEDFGDRLERAWDEGKPNAFLAAQRMGEAYQRFAREEPGLYSAMFGYQRGERADVSSVAADRAFATLEQSAAALLRHFGAPDSNSRLLALQIWSLSHGVASLAKTGVFVALGHEPGSIMDAGASAIIETAVRQALGAR